MARYLPFFGLVYFIAAESTGTKQALVRVSLSIPHSQIHLSPVRSLMTPASAVFAEHSNSCTPVLRVVDALSIVARASINGMSSIHYFCYVFD
jgi:hypothetical protein